MAELTRRRDEPTSIARRVYPVLLYGEGHPYGRPVEGTLGTVPAISRADVVAFHRLLFRPNNAALVVVGDTTAEAIAGRLEAALDGWEPGPVPAFTLPEPATAPSGPLYLVDRPGSAQSILGIYQVAVARDTPDYFPLVVLNAALGGQFTSRINMNLREDKGYTYGARTTFDFRRGPGPFVAVTPVQTAVTAPALAELRGELSGVVGDRPLTEEELASARADLVLGFPGSFATTSGVASRLEELVVYDLPDDSYTTYQDRLESVTAEAANAAARRHLDPGRMLTLVVGDREAVEPSLLDLPFVPAISPRDVEGGPVSTPDGG